MRSSDFLLASSCFRSFNWHSRYAFEPLRLGLATLKFKNFGRRLFSIQVLRHSMSSSHFRILKSNFSNFRVFWRVSHRIDPEWYSQTIYLKGFCIWSRTRECTRTRETTPSLYCTVRFTQVLTDYFVNWVVDVQSGKISTYLHSTLHY